MFSFRASFKTFIYISQPSCSFKPVQGSCQIGGIVSTNAAGIRLSYFGSLNGTVVGLEVVKGDGEVVDMMPKIKKDNTGN